MTSIPKALRADPGRPEKAGIDPPSRRPIPKKGKKKVAPTKELDRLFSLIVRAGGRCEAHEKPEDCNGPLQCAHGFTRSYRATRWDRKNAWCLCAGAHMYYTHHPIEWDEWMYKRLGTVDYLRLRMRATSGVKPDTAALLEQFRAEVKELAA